MTAAALQNITQWLQKLALAWSDFSFIFRSEQEKFLINIVDRLGPEKFKVCHSWHFSSLAMMT